MSWGKPGANSDALANSGYEPMLTGEPVGTLRLMSAEQPELVLLDLLPTGADCIELVRQMPEIGEVSVIFISAYGRENLIALAFDQGAPGYVVKPFSQTKLTARIRGSLHRRSVAEPPEPYVHSDLVIDFAQRWATLGGQPLALVALEYRLLAELAASAGRVLTYERLMERVWGGKGSGGLNPMRNIVNKLRAKLGDDASSPTYIFTEPRVGYWMPEGEGQEQDEG